MSINTANTSRRTVVKGTAWSIPAVTVAAAAPAVAASCIPKQLTVDGSVGSQDITSPDQPAYAIIVQNTGSDSIPAGTAIPLTLINSAQGYDQSVPEVTISRYEATKDSAPDTATYTVGATGAAINYINKTQADAYYEAGLPNRVDRAKSTQRRASATLVTGSEIAPNSTLRIEVWGESPSVYFDTTPINVSGGECGGTLTVTSFYTVPSDVIPADQYTPPPNATDSGTPAPSDSPSDATPTPTSEETSSTASPTPSN